MQRPLYEPYAGPGRAPVRRSAAAAPLDFDPLEWELAASLRSSVSLMTDSVRSARKELRALAADGGDEGAVLRLAECLSVISMDAEAWGFADIERLARGLRRAFWDLEPDSRSRDGAVWELMGKGLATLELLASDCEAEFRRREHVTKLLDALCFVSAGGKLDL